MRADEPHTDMLTTTWARGTRWNVAWLDIWSNVNVDDLDEMARLRRSYGQRTDWNDCWGRHMLIRHRREG